MIRLKTEGGREKSSMFYVLCSMFKKQVNRKLRRDDDCNGHVPNVDTIAGLLITLISVMHT